jgi:hypothetical protein
LSITEGHKLLGEAVKIKRVSSQYFRLTSSLQLAVAEDLDLHEELRKTYCAGSLFDLTFILEKCINKKPWKIHWGNFSSG